MRVNIPANKYGMKWSGEYEEIESITPERGVDCAICSTFTGVYRIMVEEKRFDRCMEHAGEIKEIRIKLGLEW